MNPQPASPATPPAEKHRITRFEWERAFRKARLPRHLQLPLFHIATYMDHSGHSAFPSVKTLAEDMLCTRRRVFQLLAELEALGWVETIERPGTSSERRPAIPRGVNSRVHPGYELQSSPRG